MQRFIIASAAVSLILGVAPVLAQESQGGSCPEGQFRCASLNNACTTGPQCDAADKASGKQMPSPPNGNPNRAGDQGFKGDPGFRGDPNQGGQRGPGGPRDFGRENMGPGSNFGGPNMGPRGMSDEDFAKQDEERQKREDERMKKDEERMKKEQERNAKRMQGDIKRFAGDVKRMRADIDRQKKTLQKCGIGLPQDVSAALSETDALVAKAATLTDAEEIQTIQMDLHDKMQTVRESQMDFGYLQGFCRMLPEGDKMLKRATNEYARVVKAASRNKDLDLTEIKLEFDTELGKVKGILDQVKQKMTTEPEEAMEMMQSDFFPGFEDVFMAIGQIEALSNSGKGVKMLDSQLKRFKKNRDSLAKKGKDVSELSDAVAGLESAIKELKSLRAQKKVDMDDMMAAFEEAFSATEEIGGILEEFGIYNPDYRKNFGPMNAPKFNVPQFKGLPSRPQGHDMGPGGFPGGGPGMMGPHMGPGRFGPEGPGFGPGGPDGPGGFEGEGEFGPEAKKKQENQVAKR